MTARQTIESLEDKRVAIQADLDGQKTQAERNRLGQFATPTALARDIVRYAVSLLPVGEKIRFLDPAIGTGSFYSALLGVVARKRIADALGFEIDPHYSKPAVSLWRGSGLSLRLSDFTREEASPRFNVVICNPPYVRHHHLENGDKGRLHLQTYNASGMKISGLAGLYCHFLGLSHSWMMDGGIAGWLIPSEFMDVNYGKAVKDYLLDRVTLLNIHRFDPNDVQFADALVSSAVVWFKKVPPPADHHVTFTFGGTLCEPKLSRKVSADALRNEPKWTRFPAAAIRQKNTSPRIFDFFQVKRGLATGDNSYFILTEKDIETRGLPMETFRSILPSSRYLLEDEICADKHGDPIVEPRLFLLDTKLREDEIRVRFPSLHSYLEEGKARGLHERYLCSHRSPWYAQENRPPAPIICTYLGRMNSKQGRPFRFILNGSRATVANVYLAMYPTTVLRDAMERDPHLIRHIWKLLNEIKPDQLIGEGRVYGGGLHKLEPKELANVDASTIAGAIPDFLRPLSFEQMQMFDGHRRKYSVTS
jgi:hypothetical protein